MKRYWIAINGASCALSTMPLELPIVVPRPEVLVGFPTLDEARRAQSICLASEIASVQEEFAAWVRRPDVQIMKPMNPDPPTDGPTIWQDAE